MKSSVIKLEALNDCPGAEAVKQYLYTHHLVPYINVVDLEGPHSIDVNQGDMLVLAIVKGSTAIQVALALGAMAVWFNANQLTWQVVAGTYIVQLWWN